MTSSGSERQAAARGPLRGALRSRAGRHCIGAGPRQPDRRAHRLQRRVRAAAGGAASTPSRHREPRRRAWSGVEPRARRRRDRRIPTRPGAIRVRDWLDYVQGVTWVLRAAGHALGGFEMAIESDVPLGSGLASSAALLVAVSRALREAYGLDLDDVTLARLAQRAEVEFVGRARRNHGPAVRQPRRRRARAVRGHTDDRLTSGCRFRAALGLAVIGSGVAHSNAAGEYNTRRGECEQACSLLGVTSLRDVDVADLPRIDRLPEPLAGRARHVVTENQRVLDSVAALRAGRLEVLGPLMAASHRSMRDDYRGFGAGDRPAGRACRVAG